MAVCSEGGSNSSACFLNRARFRKIPLRAVDTVCRYLYYHDTAARGCGKTTNEEGMKIMNDAAVYGFRQIAGAMGCKDAQQHTGKSYEQLMAEVEAMQAKLRAIRQEMDAFAAAN